MTKTMLEPNTGHELQVQDELVERFKKAGFKVKGAKGKKADTVAEPPKAPAAASEPGNDNNSAEKPIPDETWKLDRLKEYAAELGIETEELKTKEQYRNAIIEKLAE